MPGSATSEAARAKVRRRLSRPERRRLILNGAARVFAERGYSGASITDIARAAGIAPSVVYDHFDSKRALYLELLNQHALAMIEATTRLPAGGPPEDLVTRSTGAFFGFVEANPFAWRMLFRDPPANEHIAAVHARIHAQGAAAIARLISLAPALHPSADMPRERAAEMLASAIKSGNDGLAAWWYEHPEVPREQIVAIAADLCWRGLAGLTRAASESGP
jgi:AcrR family transcriptional regulator